MKIAEMQDGLTTLVRTFKERHVRSVKGRPGRTDIPTTIHVIRGQTPVAVISHNADRDRMLWVAEVAVRGFDADVLNVAFETYYANSEKFPLNPTTGEPWGPGEMQRAAEQDRGVARGWIEEALLVTTLNRAGDARTNVLPYRIVGRSVEWSDDTPDGMDNDDADSGNLGGYVYEVLRRIMDAPSATHGWWDKANAEMRAIAEEMGPERTRWAIDCATLAHLKESTEGDDLIVALYAEPGSPRHQWIRERFPSNQVIRAEGWFDGN